MKLCAHVIVLWCVFFFFNDTATTEIYTLSLHDALPISSWCAASGRPAPKTTAGCAHPAQDRKSTRLNSSHQIISYAVFCLKKTSGRRAPDQESVPGILPCARFLQGRAPGDRGDPGARRARAQDRAARAFFFLSNGGPRETPPLPHPALLRG